jgi:uncharacterized coiled-coil protein SlyX
MTPDVVHWLVTAGLGAFATVLAWIFITSRHETLARVGALEAQNAAQERELATLKANAAAHESTFDRLATAVEKLDDKIDALTQFLMARRTPPPFPQVK